MRLGLLGSLIVHTGLVGAAWLLVAPQMDAPAGVPGAYLGVAPRLLPERPVPPPPDLTAPAAAPERLFAPPADDAHEPIEFAAAAPPAPRPFRLRAVTKLAEALPVRRPPPPAPPTGTKAAPSRRLPPGKLVPPRLLKAPAARYPSRARRLGWEGRVVLELRVSARGAVEKVTVAASSGHAVLDRAASRAVLRWRFRPATRDGAPVAHTVRVPIDFALVPP
jgi:protein TonB